LSFECNKVKYHIIKETPPHGGKIVCVNNNIYPLRILLRKHLAKASGIVYYKIKAHNFIPKRVLRSDCFIIF